VIKSSLYKEIILECLNIPYKDSNNINIKKLYNKIDDHELMRIASENKVVPLIAEGLIAVDIPNLPSHWYVEYLASVGKMRSLLSELDNVSNLFAFHNIQFLLLENGALARANLIQPAKFSFDDFDLMVNFTDLSIVHSILINQGYQLDTQTESSDITDLYFRNNRVKYSKSISSGYKLQLNIQCSLVARIWFTSQDEPDIDTLLKRSILLPGTDIRILKTEDFLFQLCLHNAAHGYFRKPGIRLHLDVDWFIRTVDINWNVFLSLVHRYNISTRAYWTLAIPNQLFGTPVPKYVFEELCIPKWKYKILSMILNPKEIVQVGKNRFGLFKYA
jgi:hypothetical protein